MEIDEKEYNELRRNQEKLFCLVSKGVENWDEYDDAMKVYNEWLEGDKQKEKIDKIVHIYTGKILSVFDIIFKICGAKLNEEGIKEIKDILKEMCTRELTLKDKNFYEKWANDLMDKIQEIVEEKYPGVDYWIDTGSRVQACIAMLEQFKKDL